MISIDGFTPAPDLLAQRYDPLTALVFGIVYRARYMRRGQLDASVQSIAETLGLGTTAVRQRLRVLERDNWISREDRPGKTSIYHDTGKWSISLVGEPQREALPTPTRGVALPQREALPKKEVSKEEERTTPPSGGAWSAFHTVTATDLTGDPDGWRRKDGRPYAMHGWLARRIGEAVDGDVGRACELWREYATERGQYLPRNQRTLKTDFGRWLAQWQERESEAALTF